jgi:hypothetical protein
MYVLKRRRTPYSHDDRPGEGEVVQVEALLPVLGGAGAALVLPGVMEYMCTPLTMNSFTYTDIF